jgi:hypothetical protein
MGKQRWEKHQNLGLRSKILHAMAVVPTFRRRFSRNDFSSRRARIEERALFDTVKYLLISGKRKGNNEINKTDFVDGSAFHTGSEVDYLE